ncbi:MAG: hypothetical protein KatS3mg126_1555 [Lysobacteraceae bacterium]|nr:MAG: hypothetical protein KatS3mg126_1555 [Xanthomonadaceae bacterium]
MNWFDSHCHLDAPEFQDDLPGVLARARAAGVCGMLVPAVTPTGWAGLAQLAEREADLHAAFGLHPLFVDAESLAALAALPAFLDRHPAVAIGECGLDLGPGAPDPALQLEALRFQLRLARDRGLPVVLHARRAVEAVIQELRRLPGLRGVVHSFSGSPEQARQLCRMGFLLGLGGPVTYARARRLRPLAAALPVEHLVLETDAPDQPPSWRRGQRNEPAELPRIGAVLAELRRTDPDSLASATRASLRRVFAC